MPPEAEEEGEEEEEGHEETRDGDCEDRGIRAQEASLRGDDKECLSIHAGATILFTVVISSIQ